MLSQRIDLDKAVQYVHDVSALTHNHIRSKIASGIYFFMICAIIDEEGRLTDKMQKGIDEAKVFYEKDLSDLTELSYFRRLFSLTEFSLTKEDDIKSSGYVLDSIEAAVWSLITENSFENSLLKAVNLGDDTDTIGAIAGGLATLHYGYGAIPKLWKDIIIRRDYILSLCKKMDDKVENMDKLKKIVK